MNANIDFIGRNQAQGDIANRMAGNRINIGAMRPFLGADGNPYMTVYKGGDPTNKASYETKLATNATLRRDEWKQLDEAIIPISETRLTGVQDLVNKGLVYNLGNAMGTTVLEHHTISDAMEAALTMDGVTRSQGDRPSYDTSYLPIPIIHVDYEINARVLAASRSLGNPLDTSSAERATRKVVEKLENMLFTDTDYSFGGGTIYSYLNFENRNQYSITTAWDASGKTGAQIIDDVLGMKQESIDNLHYGPWMLYVPTAWETKLDEDYASDKGDNTVRDRILKIGGIQDIKVVDTLPSNNCVLVQMTPDTVRLVRGMGIQNVQWETEGKFITKYKVMTIQVPQIRADQDGKSGIVHGSV